MEKQRLKKLIKVKGYVKNLLNQIESDIELMNYCIEGKLENESVYSIDGVRVYTEYILSSLLENKGD